MFRPTLLLLLLPLSLAACAKTQPLGGSPELQVLQADALPAPQSVAGAGSGYVLEVTDKIVVDVVGVPGMQQREVQIDRGGRVALPMIGGLDVAGHTPAQVEALVAQRLRDAHVRNPIVSVNVSETTSQAFTVDGQVGEPGIYPLLNNMTLVRAVASAKGAGEFAKLDDVVLFRTVGGQRYAALYNLGAIRRGAYADPQIFANDVIVVGDSPSRRMFKNLITVLPALASPLVVALQ